MTVAAAQYPITAFTHFADWQQHVAQWVADAARQGAQVLVFPEYGAMELTSVLAPEEQQDLHRQIGALSRLLPDFLDTWAGLARQYGVAVVAPSIPVQSGDRTHNRAFVLGPNGSAGFQDKLMMTRFEDEDWGIHPAPPVLTVFESDWGAFGVQICFDVEFAFGAQVLCAEGAKVVLAPSCTETVRGAARVHIGARARALENQCYVAVSQTIGEALWSPAVDINYGYAAVYAPPDGNLPPDGIVAQMDPQVPGWLVQKIDFELIDYARLNGQVLNFQKHQQVKSHLKGQHFQTRVVRLT